ncbi:MAG TPA: histidine phosphatase family protein [bacterium]
MADAVAYVVRHGMHDWLHPGANRLAGRLPGISLNANGRRESERAAAILGDKPIAWIVSSPLERTIETAEIIARPHRCPVERDDRFIESGLGPWQGMWVDDVAARYPEDWQAWREDPTQVHLPEVEPIERIADRMEAGWREWLARGREGIIVSHQDPIAALLSRLVEMPLSSMRRWEIRTGSIAVVRLTPYGVVVEAVNAGVPMTL